MAEPLESTLEELEDKSGHSSTFPSYVVTTCQQMRRKPLRRLNNEELRLGINQEMSLRWLVPLAIQRLEANPLASGDFYEGDLLEAVLRTVRQVDLASDQRQSVDEIVERFTALASSLDLAWQEECLPTILEAVHEYRAARSKKE